MILMIGRNGVLQLGVGHQAIAEDFSAVKFGLLTLPEDVALATTLSNQLDLQSIAVQKRLGSTKRRRP